MAKLSLTASAYRVARGKAEIAREAKWQKTAKLDDEEAPGIEEAQAGRKGIEGSGDPNQPMAPGPDDPKSSSQGQAPEVIGPKAPEKKKAR